MMNDDHAKRSTDDSTSQNMARKEDPHADKLKSSNPAFRTFNSMGLKGNIELAPIKKIKPERPSEIKTAKSRKGKTDVRSDETLKKSETGHSSKDVSQFSQWLSSLAAPIISTNSEGEIEVLEEATRLASRVDEKIEDTLAGAHPAIADGDFRIEKKKKKRKKKKKKKHTSDSGVVLSDDIFSETLADLLASQGHIKQAIHMYEKMRLIYPKKSRFFAAKIEELNKKE